MNYRVTRQTVFPAFLSALIAGGVALSGLNIAAVSAPPAKPAVQMAKEEPAKPSVSTANPLKVDPLELLRAPDKYLNQAVEFEGTFNRFSDVGLDYPKAMRASKDYVTFFILRPDVKGHAIPMAELKLFYPRKKSDEVMELESGDRIKVVGVPFSTALDEPWLDVETITILQKTASSTKREEAPEF